MPTPFLTWDCVWGWQAPRPPAWKKQDQNIQQRSGRSPFHVASIPEPLLCAGFYEIHFTYVISSNHPTHSLLWWLLLSLSYKWASWEARAGKGFPQGTSLLPKCSIEPRFDSKVGVLSCRSFSKESRHKNDSASRPHPQVVHRRAMGKVNRYVTTV